MKFAKIVLAAALLFCSVTVSASVDTENHWAREYISELENNGIMNGDGNLFMPDEAITRAEFVVAAVRAIGAETKVGGNSFSDVKRDSFYAPYIAKAVEIGIISGYNDGTFRPENHLTREEAVIILSRAFGFLSGYNIGGEFSDRDDVIPSARSAFAYALRKGIVSGCEDKTLRPKGTLTRAEAAVLISKARKIETTDPGFVMGYPRIAAKGAYGKIRVEVCTNMPSGIYFSLNGANVLGTLSESNINDLLAVTTQANKQQTVDISAEVGKEYNIFLMAVTPEGKKSNVVKLTNVTALPFPDGDGTKTNPYGIYTEEQLSAVRHFSDRSFVLKNDIELAEKWTPIEDFYGSLDGAGHKISGLYVETDDSGAGLFKRISKGEIKNLTVDGKVSARANVGIIAGEFADAKISYCSVSGRVEATANNAGGFFGESAGVIENCLSGVYIVEAGSFAGGITGQNYGTIKNTLSAAYTVAADIYAGGIASVNVGGRIENSVAASVHVYDMLLGNCGRIAVGKNDAVLSGNYAYAHMITTSESGINQTDNQNGADLTWEQLISREQLCKILGWDRSEWTGGGRGESYLLPRPKFTHIPELQSGLTEYAPIRVSEAAELLGMINNPDKHYLLVNNLYFGGNVRWTPAAETELYEDGFSGTLDGGGKTIYNLNADVGENGHCGLFDTIYGGTVRNLTLYSPQYANGRIIGAIAAVNYGTIENCVVYNFNIKADGDGCYAGGIAGYNYGTIRTSDASGNIDSSAKNIVAGGICAHNEGFAEETTFSGSIKTSKMGGVSESVVGGICGYNSGGMIYNAYASADIRQQATTIYGGGICAIQSEGELYKCSSKGKMIAEQPGRAIAVAYSGGVSGLAAGGIVTNSFSNSEIKQYTLKSYAGGVCGYNEAAIIQNVYATGSVLQTSDAKIKDEMPSYAGGICGYNENGTISSSVAANKEISSYGTVARICADGTEEQIYGNYAVKMNIEKEGEGGFGGTTVAENRLDVSFFTLPLFDGGALGWSNEIWVRSNIYTYNLPVLSGVGN